MIQYQIRRSQCWVSLTLMTLITRSILFSSTSRIKETFEAFLDLQEIDDWAMGCLEQLPDLEMNYSIALWKLAVQIKKGIRGTESMK